MIECYCTDVNGTHAVDDPEPGGWVSVVAPTTTEREWMRSKLGIIEEFVVSSLDDEERAHIDYDDDANQTLIIIDCPFVEDSIDTKSPEIVQYDTHPLSMVFLPERDLLVTVSLRQNPTLEYLISKKLHRINTHQRTRLLLLFLQRVSHNYQVYLQSINQQFTRAEHELRRNMRNAELMKMLGFQNSLVYFSISLKADESMLQHIDRGRVMRMYEDDADLLQDVSIEFRQAIEMCTIYTNILEGTMDAYSSVINNSVNNVMRRLTMITVILSIPTIVFSFYGMNVAGLPGDWTWLVPLAIAALAITLGVLLFRYSKLMK